MQCCKLETIPVSESPADLAVFHVCPAALGSRGMRLSRDSYSYRKTDGQKGQQQH